jgi:hypothetical protein
MAIIIFIRQQPELNPKKERERSSQRKEEKWQQNGRRRKYYDFIQMARD